MKIFKKSKLFKICLSLFLFGIISIPTNVFADTNSSKSIIVNGQAITDPTTQELIKKFPYFKKSLEKYTNGKLAYSNEVYFKYTPKENANVKKSYNSESEVEKDFNVQKYTKQQYENEKKSELLTNSIQPFSIGGQQGGTSSWLRMTLQVYYRNSHSDYMAYNFSSWLTPPVLQYKDAIGISLSSGLIASSDAGSRHAEYQHNDPYVTSSNDEGVYQNLPVTISSEGNGVMATFDLASKARSGPLKGGSASTEYNDVMIQTGVIYNNPSVDKGWITGNYLHAEISVGSIGMDVHGVPSISWSLINDSVQGSVYVDRY